eukprot:5086003-Pyramimonas_sp.AAC.2
MAKLAASGMFDWPVQTGQCSWDGGSFFSERGAGTNARDPRQFRSLKHIPETGMRWEKDEQETTEDEDEQGKDEEVKEDDEEEEEDKEEEEEEEDREGTPRGIGGGGWR